MKNTAYVIRVITIPPICAFALFTILYFLRPHFYSGILQYLLLIFTVVLLPISAYPLQRFIPAYKDKGRQGQRSLAIITANIGYIVGIICAVLTNSGDELMTLYLTYFISGIVIIIFNKLLKIRASGHSCGVTGPVVSAIYYLGAPGIPGLLILAAVFWASLKMKRHTWSELLTGAAISAASFAISAAAVVIL